MVLWNLSLQILICVSKFCIIGKSDHRCIIQIQLGWQIGYAVYFYRLFTGDVMGFIFATFTFLNRLKPKSRMVFVSE